MLDIPSAPFQLQCHTARAVYSNSDLSDATVYSGFAMREDPADGTLLQVELNDYKNSRLQYGCLMNPDMPPCFCNTICFGLPVTCCLSPLTMST